MCETRGSRFSVWIINYDTPLQFQCSSFFHVLLFALMFDLLIIINLLISRLVWHFIFYLLNFNLFSKLYAIIFCVQFCCSDESRQKTLAEARQKMHELQNTKWHQVAVELEREDPYQFLRAYSPGSYQCYFKRNVDVSRRCCTFSVAHFRTYCMRMEESFENFQNLIDYLIDLYF